MRPALTTLCVAVAISLSRPAISFATQVPSVPLQFDFSASRLTPTPGFTLVTPASRYSREQQFGLLTDSLVAVERAGLAKVLGDAESDGLSKNGPIDFRVDIPAGKYVIEVMMDGGELDAWRGEISVNGKTIATALESFGYSAESRFAPLYWACLRPCETDVDHVILRIRSVGQRTSINMLAIYPITEWPIRFDGGIFVQTSRAAAPNFDLALKLINSGKVTEATRIIDALPAIWNIDRAHLLMAIASRPETQTPRQFLESASAIFSTEFAKTNDQALRIHMRLLELLLVADRHYKQAGWQWARDINGLGIFGNCEISGTSSLEVASIPGHPLWFASLWALAKTCYWLWVEQHVPRMIHTADSLFALARTVHPDFPLLALYQGEASANSVEIPLSPDVPRWAGLQTALTNRLRDVIHYWCDTRQANNGEFGGKYDDDVEMLRWWAFARVGIDDSLTRIGMRRIVDGIWASEWISNGWCRKVRDVEHSSEPVADTQPMMIAFEYGNPVFVERCMQSARLALDLWTAKNSRGHRHFRSSWYSSTEVDTVKPKDCDVPYNTRTVKAIRWFAWYTRHPMAMRFLREWSDSWLEDCLRIEKGKPAGIVPAAVRFADDAIGGHADNWHHPGLYWRYYDYDGGADMMMEFLSSYQLFGDRKYLKPIEMSLELVQKYPYGDSGSTGTEAWAAAVLRESGEFWEAVELWRLLSGESRFDALLMERGSPYLKYRLGSGIGTVERELSDLLQTVDRNYALMTTEAYFTDRVEIRDIRGPGEGGTSLLESMYLGAPLGNLFFPFSPVFWKSTNSSFSALVEGFSPTSVRIRVFNHSADLLRGEATFPHLEPGEYEILQGRDANGDGKVDQVRDQKTCLLGRRGASVSLSFPARVEELIIVQRTEPVAPREESVCDLAITTAELSVTRLPSGEAVITLPVHNIGTADASDVRVELTSIPEGAVLKATTIRRIEAPLDLVPRSETVSFTVPGRRGRYGVRLRSAAQEITVGNNFVEFEL